MNRIAKIVRKTLKIFLPLFLGISLFWYLYRNQDINQIKEILRSEINYWWILLSMAIGVLSHVLRAYRWRLQIRAMGEHVSMQNLTNAIFGTYAVNLVFPRLGEVWRSTYISRRSSLPFTKVLGSVVSDRLTDTVTVALITGVVFLLQMPVFIRLLADYPETKEKLYDLVTSPWLYIIVASAIGLSVLLFRKNNTHPWVVKIKQVCSNLWAGFSTVIRMKDKNWFLFYTALIWTCYFLQLYVCFFAFSFCENLGITIALVLFVMGSLSAGLPVQGAIGPWHFAVISAMVIYGVNRTEAGAFALVAHGIQLVVILLLGFYTMISIALENRNKKSREPILKSVLEEKS